MLSDKITSFFQACPGGRCAGRRDGTRLPCAEVCGLSSRKLPRSSCLTCWFLSFLWAVTWGFWFSGLEKLSGLSFRQTGLLTDSQEGFQGYRKMNGEGRRQARAPITHEWLTSSHSESRASCELLSPGFSQVRFSTFSSIFKNTEFK